MKNDISFVKPSFNTTISNKEKYKHVFEGTNHSNETITVKEVTKGCSCTSVVYPESIPPKSTFGVVAEIDKVGDKGFFSVGIKMIFSNDQKIKLNVNGSISSD